jgi:fucose permease
MKRNLFLVALILAVFFVISFLTNIIGPLLPDIINTFNLSLGLAGFLPFSFFVAYGVMSIPAGIMIEKYGEKRLMIISFILATIGALSFAISPTFSVALPSLFIIGIGMAMLQVAINPLLRVAGGEEHFAFNSVLAQLVFGAASFMSPLVYSHLVTNLAAGNNSAHIRLLASITPERLPWVSIYWVFALLSAVMVLTLSLSKLPSVERKEEEKAGAWKTHKALLENRTVILFLAGIFCYVGTEQGIANWMSKFLADYHGIDPQTTGAEVVSSFWGLLTAGCLLGLLLLKFIDSRKVLIAFAIAALVCLSVGLFGSANASLYCFPLTGFCLSVMWSIVFSLALNSLESHHGTFSGILCTGIVGGALVPLAIGWMGDSLGLRHSMMLLYLTLGYILSIGIWAKPLISNETLSLRKREKYTV